MQKDRDRQALQSRRQPLDGCVPCGACVSQNRCEAGVPDVRVLVSVSKKCFKRAVKRNRVKRQLREAFRLNKSILYEQLEQQEGTALLIALIWIDDKLWPTSEVEKKVVNLMHRLSEKIERSMRKHSLTIFP